jgi:hypothetical protein
MLDRSYKEAMQNIVLLFNCLIMLMNKITN